MSQEDKKRLDKLRKAAIHFLNKAETTDDLITIIKGMAGMISFTERFGKSFFKMFMEQHEKQKEKVHD